MEIDSEPLVKNPRIEPSHEYDIMIIQDEIEEVEKQ